jgi:hypothetical protein
MTAVQTVLLAVLLLAWAVWAGGMVTIVVVTATARRTLDPATRVEFLRDLGSRFLPIGAGALAVALVTGCVLLVQQPWTLASTVAVVLGVVLAAALAVGVAQARRMTTLRQAAATAGAGSALAVDVRTGARRAAVLRGGLGVLTVAVLVAALIAVG